MESRGKLMLKLAQQQLEAQNKITSSSHSIDVSPIERDIVDENIRSQDTILPFIKRNDAQYNTDGKRLQPHFESMDLIDNQSQSETDSKSDQSDFSADSFDDPLFKPDSTSEQSCSESEAETLCIDIQNDILHPLQHDIESPSVIKKNVRKRIRNPLKWKCSERKRLCQSGKPYTSRRGKSVPGKQVKEVSGCSKCPFRCNANFTSDERNIIFSSFYTLQQNEKMQFLLQQSERVLCSRKKRTNEAGPSRKTFSFLYYLTIKNEKVRVCKSFFLKTLDISQKMVYNAHINKTNANSAKPDGRGKSSGSSRLLDTETKEKIIEHINSFPAVDSHYCRQDTQRKYLESSFNVSKMYGLYEELCKKENTQPAKESTYRRIFNTEFNIGFHIPKSYRCDLCEAHNNLVKYNLPINENQKIEYDNHILNKGYMRTERDADKRGDIPILSFDLQNVITLPRAEISSFFYRRKLTVYNLTAKLSLTNQVYCAIWNESMSGRAGNDIASAMKKILETVINENVLANLILWSDSCVPQNRNSHISKCIMEFVEDNPEMNDVLMKFSVPGHSCIQEIDHVHSCIEKELRKTEIYSPIGLIRLLKLVNRKQPYKIIQMKATDFKDYSAASKYFNYKEVPFSKVSVLKFTRILPEVQYKLSHADNDFITANIRLPERTKRKKQQDEGISVFLTRSTTVTTKPALSMQKLNDLKQMLKFMPPQDANFYKVNFKI